MVEPQCEAGVHRGDGKSNIRNKCRFCRVPQDLNSRRSAPALGMRHMRAAPRCGVPAEKSNFSSFTAGSDIAS